MSAGHGVEASTALLRPRDQTSMAEDTCVGKGRQGEGKGEESGPWRLERPVAVTAAVENESDGRLEPVDASLYPGVVLDEEASPLPVR